MQGAMAVGGYLAKQVKTATKYKRGDFFTEAYRIAYTWLQDADLSEKTVFRAMAMTQADNTDGYSDSLHSAVIGECRKISNRSGKGIGMLDVDPELRLVLCLRHQMGYDLNEIAAILGIKPAAAREKLAEAMISVRKLMKA